MNNTIKRLTCEEKEIIRKTREECKSYSEIGKVLGRSKRSIEKYCQRNNLGGVRAKRPEIFTDEQKVIIQRMRNEKSSYDKIAKTLGFTKEEVRSYCRRRGLSGYRARRKIENPEQEFILEFNKRFGNRYEYISGYKNSKSYITLKCKTCSNEFDRIGDFITKDRNVNCPHCVENERKQKIESESKMKLVSRLVKALNIETGRKQRDMDLTKCCDECNETFKATHMNQILCKSCRKKRENRRKELKRRKIHLNGEVDTSISLEKLIHKEKNLCYLCGGECNSNDFAIDDKGSFIVGPNYPTIEHIIPISKGGTHTWDNVKLAHHYCNTMKRDKEVLQDSGQLCLSL